MAQPRFANPHLRTQVFERATRAEIYVEDATRDRPWSAEGDKAAVEALTRLIEASLPTVAHIFNSPGATAGMSSTRDKVHAAMEADHDDCEEQPEELVCLCPSFPLARTCIHWV